MTMKWYIEGYGDEEMEEDYDHYPAAVRRLNEIGTELDQKGWDIEVGWASRDNLSAFKATKGSRVKHVQIVIDHEHEPGEHRRRGGRHRGTHTGMVVHFKRNYTGVLAGAGATITGKPHSAHGMTFLPVAYYIPGDKRKHTGSFSIDSFEGGLSRKLTAAERDAKFARLVATGKAVKAAPPKGRKRRKAPMSHAAAVRRARRR